jgi:hypothetical protein
VPADDGTTEQELLASLGWWDGSPKAQVCCEPHHSLYLQQRAHKQPTHGDIYKLGGSGIKNPRPAHVVVLACLAAGTSGEGGGTESVVDSTMQAAPVSAHSSAPFGPRCTRLRRGQRRRGRQLALEPATMAPMTKKPRQSVGRNGPAVKHGQHLGLVYNSQSTRLAGGYRGWLGAWCAKVE